MVFCSEALHKCVKTVLVGGITGTWLGVEQQAIDPKTVSTIGV